MVRDVVLQCLPGRTCADARACATVQDLLLQLARRSGLQSKIAAMAAGEHINLTEDRPVMHIALRAPRGKAMIVDGKDVVPDVHAVLDAIRAFSDAVRSGAWTVSTAWRRLLYRLDSHVSNGAASAWHRALRASPSQTSCPLASVAATWDPSLFSRHCARVCVCVTCASRLPLPHRQPLVLLLLSADGASSAAAAGRTLRFLANVDPVDVSRAVEGLDPETTLVCASPRVCARPCCDTRCDGRRATRS
jgi:hypothetical protein